MIYGFSPGSCTWGWMNVSNLTDVRQDVANFLLVRGDYAYLGHGDFAYLV